MNEFLMLPSNEMRERGMFARAWCPCLLPLLHGAHFFSSPASPTAMITFNCLFGLDYNACATDSLNRLSPCLPFSSTTLHCHQRCPQSVYVCLLVLFTASNRANLLFGLTFAIYSSPVSHPSTLSALLWRRHQCNHQFCFICFDFD